MFRNARIRFAAALAMLSTSAVVPADTVDVAVGGPTSIFFPQHVVVVAGDSVRWSNSMGFHNVRSDDCATAMVSPLGCTFRCANGCDGQGGNGNPSSAGWQATVAFATPGVFGYHCEVHGSPGASMFGTVTVLAIVFVDGFEDETTNAWSDTQP